MLQVENEGKWEDYATFTFEPILKSDLEVLNYYHCHCPNSFIRSNLLCVLQTLRGKKLLVNNKFRIIEDDKVISTQVVGSLEDLE